jgi:hypothetical protein
MDLILTPNLQTPDDLYEALVQAHDGLTPEGSQALNARLILILMNHIGDAQVIRQALETARS